MKISTSLEEYLSAIYQLKSQEGVRVTDIANYLNVQKSSTNKALNGLKEEGLINYEKYQNVTLTTMGKARAKQLYKTHQLFKKFLTQIIKTDENLADEEAEKLAHCVSCHTAAKLEKFIEGIFENGA